MDYVLRINKLLKERKIKPNALAVKINVSPKTMYNYLSGNTDIPLSKFLIILQEFGISMEDFFGDDFLKKEPIHYTSREEIINILSDILAEYQTKKKQEEP